MTPDLTAVLPAGKFSRFRVFDAPGNGVLLLVTADITMN
jgi:hypothetical protein